MSGRAMSTHLCDGVRVIPLRTDVAEEAVKAGDDGLGVELRWI